MLAPHAADSEQFRPGPPPAGVFRFLFVGRLENEKGVDTLLAAGDLLWEGGLRGLFDICLVGTGKLEQALRNLAKDRPWLRLAGFKEGQALVESYQSAHAFTLPTRWDTYGVVLYEAACCGLPLLAGREAGAVELLVVEGETGWALDAEDPAAWADKMAQLVRNPAMAAAMGSRARAVAQPWGVKTLGTRTLAWLKRLGRR